MAKNNIKSIGCEPFNKGDNDSTMFCFNTIAVNFNILFKSLRTEEKLRLK